jgi:hypothetical protein
MNAEAPNPADDFLIGRRTYHVQITPKPPGTWCLQAQTHKYRPCLRYWAMMQASNSDSSTGRSIWTLWFAFREPPMENLDKIDHLGLACFLAEDTAPHHLFVPGFVFDLFVGPGETIAKGLILKPQDNV